MELRRRTSPPDPRPLAGRVVVVTGGARGIGLATARVLRSRGALVAIGDLDVATATTEAARLGPGTFAGPVDVTDRDSFAAFLDAASRALGPVDVLVNNAGVMAVGPVTQEPDAATQRMIDVNVHGVILGTKLALERMLPRGRGHIVNVASMAGVTPVAGIATYCASKHAVIGFTESVRREHRDDGIDFTLIMPTFVATDLAAGTKQLRGLPLLQPGDVAIAIAEAVAHPRPQVSLPRVAGALAVIGRMLPRRARDLLADVFGSDDAITGTDRDARRDYEERLTTGTRE